MKSATFSRVENGIKYKAIVNDYPDTIMQSENNDLYSLIEEPNINADMRAYNGIIETRPMKWNSNLTGVELKPQRK